MTRLIGNWWKSIILDFYTSTRIKRRDEKLLPSRVFLCNSKVATCMQCHMMHACITDTVVLFFMSVGTTLMNKEVQPKNGTVIKSGYCQFFQIRRWPFFIPSQWKSTNITQTWCRNKELIISLHPTTPGNPNTPKTIKKSIQKFGGEFDALVAVLQVLELICNFFPFPP